MRSKCLFCFLISFEGVSVTTVILAPGACGLGLRAALLATTSLAPVAAVAPVAVFQKSPISCYLSYLRARGLSKIDPNPSLAPVQPRRGSGRALAGYFGRRKSNGGLFWPRKNLERAILAAGK